MSPCERIESHLSALADGELRPLEAIAMRRHLAACPSCERELEALESLKLTVHVAASDDRPTPGMQRRWQGALRAHVAEAEARARPARGLWLPSLAVAAALVAGLTLASPLGALLTEEAPSAAEAALDQSALTRMAQVHRGVARTDVLDDLVRVGALITFEGLPGGFISPEGERSRVVPASFADCDGSVLGSSLAVFRNDRVLLPPEVEAALATSGVYIDVFDGVDVRVSASGEKVFVLLSEVYPMGGTTSI